MPTHSLRRLGSVAAAAVLALTLASCGQEDDAVTEDPAAGTSDTLETSEAARAAADWLRGELGEAS